MIQVNFLVGYVLGIVALVSGKTDPLRWVE